MKIPQSLRAILIAMILAVSVPARVRAAGDDPAQTADLEAMTRIRQEGFRHSQVMQTMSELADRIGPRLTGSPELKAANEWTKNKLAEWGLANAHLESWGPFGRGWQEQFTSVRMVAPDIAMLHAIPRAWTPGTDGVVRAKVVKVKIEKKEDLEKYRGKLAGTMVLNGDMREVKASVDPLSERYTDKKLEELEQYQIPADRSTGPFNPEERRRRMELGKLATQFFLDEKVVAVFEPSQFDEGLITMSGTQAYKPGEQLGVPTLNLAVENYGRITRLLERDVPVELELNVQTKFFDEDPMAYNTIAEIPGTDKDKKDEIVMLGAHLDSWHGGTGATDNGAGSAAVMEAVRILKMAGIKPRRTIRIALWTGEEEGLLGSRAYVKEHFASRPEPTDPKEKELPEFLRRPTGPLQLKPEYAKLAAYFNIDNGTGKLRGIYLQENAAVWPIFEKWIEAVKDLGVSAVTMRNTGGTDHLSFDGVGLPGFQFIQDPIEYSTRTHHTNMDVYERLQREDLMQQAVVMAWFVYNAAMCNEMLPRAPLPRQEPPAAASPAMPPKS